MDWTMDWNRNLEWSIYFLAIIITEGRSFVCALPEDRSTASWSQCAVVLSHGQGREREEAAAIKIAIDHTARILTDPGEQPRRSRLDGY